MDQPKKKVRLSKAEELMPQEEMLAVKQQKSILTIGIPKEAHSQERRISLVPEAVGLLVQNGHSILLENDAGKAARFSDHDYSENGAQIVSTSEEVYKADLILKVAPPDLDEVERMKDRQVLISTVNLQHQTQQYFRSLIRKKITALAFEHIQDDFGSFPLRRSISEIVGNASIMLAARYLADPEYGKGNMLGGFSGITPSEVVIIGAGTVGENAARVALGMGASVKVFDSSIYKLRRVQYFLQNRIYTSIIQPKVLLKALKSADVVIGALHAVKGKSPCVVTEEMVKQMKYGSVIIDVSIDQGGCVETSEATTHQNPVFKKHEVIHYCVPNISSQVPHTASYALSNFFTPVLLNIGEEGGVEKLVRRDHGLAQGMYLFKGVLTNKYISDSFGLPFQDLDLLLASYH
jgi:alanine dehydrogenase